MGISCKKATELTLKKADGRISLPQRLQLWQHQLVCVLCRRFVAQMNLLDKLFKRTQIIETESLSVEEKENIIALLREDDTGS